LPVDPLTVADAPVILSHWKYAKNNPSAASYIDYLIKNHPSGAIRNEKGELEAWVLVHLDWSVGMLHTIEACRGRGHGKRIVMHIARELIARGFAPLAYASADNTPSLSLFSSLGFVKEPGDLCWMMATY